MDLMSDKQITSGTLSGEVKITSEQFAPDGTLEIATDLRAERVDYDQITGRLDVPVPGNMVYRDARPPAKDQSKGPTLGSGRGATVFAWSKSLVYDQPRLEATMLGDVRVIHEPDNENSQKFELSSQSLKATFEPAPTTQPATKPAAGPAAMKDLQAKSVVATGDVHVKSSRLVLDAPQLSFDMLNQTLIATGDEQHPITVFDASTGSTQSASKVFWNTKTDEIRMDAMRVKARQ